DRGAQGVLRLSERRDLVFRVVERGPQFAYRALELGERRRQVELRERRALVDQRVPEVAGPEQCEQCKDQRQAARNASAALRARGRGQPLLGCGGAGCLALGLRALLVGGQRIPLRPDGQSDYREKAWVRHALMRSSIASS